MSDDYQTDMGYLIGVVDMTGGSWIVTRWNAVVTITYLKKRKTGGSCYEKQLRASLRYLWLPNLYWNIANFIETIQILLCDIRLLTNTENKKRRTPYVVARLFEQIITISCLYLNFNKTNVTKMVFEACEISLILKFYKINYKSKFVFLLIQLTHADW